MKKNNFIAVATIALSTTFLSCSSNDSQNTAPENQEVDTVLTSTADMQNEETTEAETTQPKADPAETAQTETTPAETAVSQTPDWMPKDAKITSTGLGIVIENEGDNTRATKTTPMKIHYQGKLTNGKVFDSSYARGEPAVFMPAQVVPGFGEGIMMLGRGGKATLYIPSNLGYGPTGTPGGPIGPNENLIFDIEVVDIMQ